MAERSIVCYCCERRIGHSPEPCACSRFYCTDCLLCATHCTCTRSNGEPKHVAAFRTREAAAFLGISVRTLYTLRRKGLFPCGTRLRRDRRFWAGEVIRAGIDLGLLCSPHVAHVPSRT